jgi:hypothetical protein
MSIHPSEEGGAHSPSGAAKEVSPKHGTISLPIKIRRSERKEKPPPPLSISKWIDSEIVIIRKNDSGNRFRFESPPTRPAPPYAIVYPRNVGMAFMVKIIACPQCA